MSSPEDPTPPEPDAPPATETPVRKQSKQVADFLAWAKARGSRVNEPPMTGGETFTGDWVIGIGKPPGWRHPSMGFPPAPDATPPSDEPPN